MTSSPESQARPFLAETRPGLAAMIAMGVFFGGGAAGSWLAHWLAPGSGLVAMISFLALPAAFMLSMVAWQGLTILIALVKFLKERRRTRTGDSALQALARRAWLMIPMPVIFLTIAGFVAGILGEHGFVKTVAIYALSGFAYGLACFALGRAGMLPLLED